MFRDFPLHGQGLSIGIAWPRTLHCMVRDSPLAFLGRDSPLHGQGLSIAWSGTLHCIVRDSPLHVCRSLDNSLAKLKKKGLMVRDCPLHVCRSQFVWQLQGLHSCDFAAWFPPLPPFPSYLLICLPQLIGTPVFLTSSLHLPRLPCLATPLRWWIVVTTHPVSGSPPLWLGITWCSTENGFSPSWLFMWSHSQRTVWSGLLQDITTNNNMDWWKETNHLEYFVCLSVFLFVTWLVQVQESRQFEIYWPQESVWTKTLSLVTGHFSWDGPFWIKAQTRPYLASCRAVGNQFSVQCWLSTLIGWFGRIWASPPPHPPHPPFPCRLQRSEGGNQWITEMLCCFSSCCCLWLTSGPGFLRAAVGLGHAELV